MRTHAELFGVNRGPRTQSGAAMVIALVMLLVLTLLATASARMTLLEERMTGNTQDHNVAFQAAETALRAGEKIAEAAEMPDFEDEDGLYQPAAANDSPVWEALEWTDADAVHADEKLDEAIDSLPGATASYIVEELPRIVTAGNSRSSDTPVDDSSFYRVTAHGVGIAGNAAVTLQTTFKR